MTEFILPLGLSVLLHWLLTRYKWLRYVVGVGLLLIGLPCACALMCVIVSVWGIGWSAGIAGLLITAGLAYVVRALLARDGDG